MKKIILILSLFFLISACDSLLDEEVFDQVTPNNFFQKEKDVATAVNGVYDGIQNHGLWYHMTMLGDALPGSLGHFWPSAFRDITQEDNSSWVWNPWRLSYKAIGRANSVLAALENSTLDDASKARFEGEVRFLRAYNYFNLVRMYGRIPLVKSAPASLSEVVLPDTTASADALDSEFFRQVERAEVYDFVIEDLQFAEANLPQSYDNTNSGRATSGAAAGMLAKVYLTLAGMYYDSETGELKAGDAANYAKVIEQCEKVMAMSYELEANFADVFATENEIGNAEILFAIKYLQSSIAGVTGEGNQLQARFGIRGASITPFSWKQAFVNDDFFNDWVAANTEDDNRFNATFLTEFVNDRGKTIQVGDMATFLHPHVRKFLSDIDEGPDPQISALGATDYGTDWPVIRYADILLMHSEALNESGGTPDANTIMGINLIRERAGKALITLPVTQEELRDLIFDERKWELAFEGQYFFDSQRTGRLLDEIAKGPGRAGVAEVRHNILPIPFNAMEANPTLKQNFGW